MMEGKTHLLNSFGNKGIDLREKSIYQLFEEQVERTSDQMTYGELNECANWLAQTLRAEGVQPDQPVGIMAERSPDMIVGILGILKARGVYMPIDPEYLEKRIQYLLEDSGAKMML